VKNVDFGPLKALKQFETDKFVDRSLYNNLGEEVELKKGWWIID